MTSTVKRHLLCGAMACAFAYALAAPAVADPDQCTFSGTTATCSGNQADGISFVDIPGSAPIVGTFPTTLNVEDLTSVIAPAASQYGINLDQELNLLPAPGTAGTVGASSQPFVITTDATTTINVTGSAASGIRAVDIGGNGSDGNSSTVTGGNGGAGASITIDNLAAITATSTRTVESRAIEFNETSTLNAIPGDIAQLSGIISEVQADPNTGDLSVLFFKLYYQSQSIDVSTPDKFIVALQGAIQNLDALQTSLNGTPLPEETGQLIAGAISATSTGGNAGAGGIGGGGSGSGGDGGAGGNIIISNGAVVQASGGLVAGIAAESIGGNGGFSDADFGGLFGGNLTIGTGGNGGAGGDITITNSGAITTTGDSAPGIFALSRGGQAGSGDNNPNFTPPGGSGGTVTVNEIGTISTSGVGSYGVFAQSQGGLGLSGGDAKIGGAGGDVVVDVSGTIATTGDTGYGVFARSVGGTGGNGSSGDNGGDGGPSGLVTASVAAGGVITTQGENAIALYAQSKGGDGGSGGNESGFWASAGGGGNGGVGGNVQISNAGTITTSGDYAYGLFGQALGGGGGVGGNAAGLVAISGSGGGGSPAGNVVADNSGIISTSGIGANAFYAQSVGGVGGDAGGAGGLAALGSDGGGEAQTRCENEGLCLNGGNITATNEGTLATSGDQASAMFLETIGGGGGNGGGSSGLFSWGGSGGAGGNGGVLDATNGGILHVGGNQADAIFAQSVGGGGGAGGDATSFGTTFSVAIGGSGGSGGNGGDVTVTNSGAISVSGYEDTALFAQSVGGGGGNGGDATSFSASAAVSASIAIGGSGGGGGFGSDVVVNNTGSISTQGDFSDAIFAQSVGGGGGTGGAAYATSFAAGGGDIPAVSISVALGGSGGGGGDGHDVTVTNSGSIVTQDWNARGIFAQSVGGGGGDGGSSAAKSVSVASGTTVAVSFALGGTGGDGGSGGDVLVDNEGSVTTFGSGSHAIFAQSVGGGGGTGGDASTTTASFQSDKDAELSLSIGGKGGAGGTGGNVKVINNGSVTTVGDMARGITAQSVGGGGGDGGAGQPGQLIDGVTLPTIPDLGDDLNGALKNAAMGNFDDLQKEFHELKDDPAAYGKKLVKQQVDPLTEKPSSIGLSIGIGGAGGVGGNGGTADVENNGSVLTAGFMSDGIMAQSVGGGGGSGGGGSGSASGDVNVGGGFGGNGGSAGTGGLAEVTNTGSITTFGDMAYGIFAQSVGGGGGDGGAGNGQGDGVRSLSISVGGQAGSAGDGGTVSVDQSGNVITFGDNSVGVYAQSVGGGGGVGGSAQGQNYLTVAVGGAGGSGGNGGDITVNVNGDIATSGAFAHGVFAQSVGGGGGQAGSIEAATLVLSDPFGLTSFDTGVPFTLGTLAFEQTANGSCDTPPPPAGLIIPILVPGPTSCGNGGKVVVDTTGNITTTGMAADGIFAQSVGGGGGYGDEQTGGDKAATAGLALIGSTGGDGTAGTITINHSGSIQTFGQNSIGIYAQSISGADATTHQESGGRGSDITITVNGTIQGGTGAGAGVFISGGDQNTLTNNGGAISALSGLAIIASDGDDTIDNHGRITGNVGLGAGANAFINEQGGLFEPGKAAYLGAGNTLTNSGTLSPSAAGSAGSTLLTGNLVQTASGLLLVDVNFAGGASDLLTVDGNASLAGKAMIVPQNVTAYRPGDYFTVLTATGTLTDNGISIDDTLAVDYGVKFVGSNFQVGVNSVQFDFGGPLNPNQEVIADQIQKVWAAGGGGMNPLLNYLASITDAKTYADVLSRLDPSTGLSQSTAALLSSASNVNSLMSCPGTDSAADALRENECFWARASGSNATRDATSSQPGYNSSGYGYAMGRQVKVAPGWFVGVSAGIAQNSIDVQNLAHDSSSLANGGVVVKHEDGDWLFAGALDLQYAWNKQQRFVAFPVPATMATSSPSQFFADGRARVAYLASSGDAYFKPWAAADVYYADAPGYNEKGAGPLNMLVSSSNKTFGSGTLGVEAGILEAFSDGSSLRPYVSADATAYSDDSWDMSARFQGAPAGVPNFTVSNRFPGVLGRALGGLEVNLPTGSLKFEYERRFGDHYSDQTGSLKLRFAF